MDALKTFITNDSVFKTFFDPRTVVACHPPSFSMLPLLLPLFIQCALLHPQLTAYRISHYIRWALVPFNFYFALKVGVDYCFTPLNRRGVLNLMLGSGAIHLAMKSLEWGLLGRYEISKYRTRPEFVEKDITGETDKKDDDAKDTSSETNTKRLSLKELYLWTAEQFTSCRGVQYEWGVNVPPNTRSIFKVLWRLMKVHLVHLASVAFSVHIRDSGSAVEALRSLGISFPGSGLVAETLSTLAFGIYIVSLTDLGHSYHTLFIHFISAMESILPSWYRVYFDLKLQTPLYDSPHRAKSLVQLWSTGWHQYFRRSFICCGSIPARKIAGVLGFARQPQKIAGVLGCFIVSGIMHELVIHFIARAPHPSPHVFFDTRGFPGSLFYFLMQPVGIMIEPKILKYVPSPWMWLFGFTLLSATPFRFQYFAHDRLLDQAYPSLSQWDVVSVLVPGGMMRL